MDHKNESQVTTTKKSKNKVVGTVIFLFITLIFVVATASLIWAGNYYGNITIDEILFHLSVPLAGTADYIISDFITNMLMYAIPFIVVIAVFWLVFWKAKQEDSKLGHAITKFKDVTIKWSWIGFIAWVLVLIFMLNNYFGLFAWIKAQTTNSTFIEENYIDANDVKIEFPEEKRNLIHIIIESGETTNQDKANGGIFDENYIPEMTNYAKNNISFSHSELIEGAAVAPACGWSIAGLVCQTSGIPLKLFKYDDTKVDNMMGNYASFLPGATSIGEILANEGYKNYFLSGSEWDFGGGTTYLSKHGNYTVWDYDEGVKEGVVDKDYYVWWGFEDKYVYEWGKEKLTEIAQDDQPFNFVLTTCDTHHEDGYVCDLCQKEHGSNKYANVWRCASRQLDDFIKWIQDQPFYENTTIVITGDHCSMDSNFYDSLKADKHNGSIERKVYNCIINAPIEPTKETGRKFTTIDFYPTILASIGATIEGNRIGLGTNLFSDVETLAEQYGYDVLFDELNRKSTFYNNKLLYE